MKTSYSVAQVWQIPPGAFIQALSRELASRVNPDRPVRVFFRADDCAAPGRAFTRLTDIFSRHRVPLSMALVPCWLPMHFHTLGKTLDLADPLWCWHMHGFRHANHEPAGSKKMEFGPSRPDELKREQLARGRDILERHLGSLFHPVFTPPWNNCDLATLDALRELGFKAVSRAVGVTPPSPKGFPDLAVNVDLHTRNEPNPRAGRRALSHQFLGAFESGLCGVMIHHQLMNGNAAQFLNLLLPFLRDLPGVELVHFGHMAAG